MKDSDRRKWHLFIVPGSHFDLGWCASPAETFAYSDLIIREAIDAITGDFPEYRFTVEYAMFLKHFLDTYPRYRKIVKRLIDEGKFEVCAAWTGMMDQVMDGEAVIRNVVLAKRWAAEQFGVDLVTAQLTDCPGHTIQLAQILARCGVKHLAYSRYSAPTPLHRWRSPDGSEVVAANHSVGLYKSLRDAAWAGSGYGWGLILRRSIRDIEDILPGHLKDIEDLWPEDQPVLMGEEMDLIPGNPGIIETADGWNEKHPEITLELSTTTQFFESVREEDLPEYCGEAPYGFYTLGACRPSTYIQAKYAHHALTSAEKMAALQEILDLGRGNKASLDEAWAALFVPQDHNVGGRHGEINDVVRHHCVEKAMIAAGNVAEEAMLFIMTQIDYPSEILPENRRLSKAKPVSKPDFRIGSQPGIPIVLFNPLSWERSDAVETYIETREEDVGNIAVFNPEGQLLPTQFLRSEENNGLKRVHFLFLAGDMPSVGYKAFYARIPKEISRRPRSWLSVSRNVLENQSLRISLEAGSIKSILWKQREIELSREAEAGFGEIIVYEDVASDISENLTGRVWQEVEENRRVEVLETGPLRGRIRIESAVLGCPVTKELSLYDGLPWIELSVTIYWTGEKNREVVLSLPLNVPGGEITYETPYGHVVMGQNELPGTYRGRGGRYVQKWVDVSNGQMGVCVGTDCVSHILSDTDICPMLIRTAYSCGTPNHWYDNIGRHSFRFSLLPHWGGWNGSEAFRIGWQHVTPMSVGRMNICAPIAPIAGRTFLPQSYSLCQVSPNNVVLTTIKKADGDRDGYIARLVEIGGKDTDVSLGFGFKLAGAWKTDLMERDVEKLASKIGEGQTSSLKFHIAPYEICTVRVLPLK